MAVNEIRLAVLSDIHGNRWALEAVLSDIRRHDVNGIVNLGDVLYGPLDPRGTADILIPLQIPTVRGNEDRIIIHASQDEDSSTLRFVRRELDESHLEWVRQFPTALVVYESLFFCHASPDSDCSYLLREVLPSGVILRYPAAVQDALGSLGVPVILCGHDHVPCSMRLASGALVVNPGSVGLPAYYDSEPYPHVMETGSPHARYAILQRAAETWDAEHITVSYDWESAAQCAVQNGRPDWAVWLRTGTARGC